MVIAAAPLYSIGVPDCTCRGANPNCFRCSGTGVLGTLGASRPLTNTTFERELSAIVARPSSRIRLKKAESAAIGPRRVAAQPPQAAKKTKSPDALCPHCGTGVRPDRLDRHIKERCPKLHVRKTARVKIGANPGQVNLGPPKQRNKQKRFVVARDESQDRFERKLIQGGLCSGR